MTIGASSTKIGGMETLSPETLFIDITYIDEEWKLRIEELVMRHTGYIPLIDEDPRCPGRFVWHTLTTPHGVSKKVAAEWFETKSDRVETEREYQKQFCTTLRERGVSFKEQVQCSSGIADVVDATYAYELKPQLSEFVRACGQAVLYAASLGRKPCVVVPYAPRTGRLEAAQRAGIRVEVFAWRRPK